MKYLLIIGLLLVGSYGCYSPGRYSDSDGLSRQEYFDKYGRHRRYNAVYRDFETGKNYHQIDEDIILKPGGGIIYKY